MKKALKISGVFLSSLIGAGFSSGSEILYYFSKFRYFGFFGIVLASFLFAVLEYIILTQTKKNNYQSLDQYVFGICPKPLAIVFSFSAYFFMTVIFAAMLSGFGEAFNIIYPLKKVYGVLLLCAVCFIILGKGYHTFIACESTLSVIIIVSMLIGAVYLLMFRENCTAAFKITDNWGFSSVSYCGYNILTNCALLCILSSDCDKKCAKISSIITGTSLLIILTLYWYIICIYSGMIPLGEIPLLTIFSRHLKVIYTLYLTALFISMITTAVSSAYALKVKLSQYVNEKIASAAIVFTGIFMSGFDFSFFVNKLYRYVGVLSILLIIYIIHSSYSDRSVALR